MNRRQRRSEAAKSGSKTLKSADDIPLDRPVSTSSNSQPKQKTLYDIAAERQKALAQNGQPFPKSSTASRDSRTTKMITLNPDGTISPNDAEDSSESTTTPENEFPILDTVFLALPLSFLHFTLSVLTANQYAQKINFAPLIVNTIFLALPFLTFLIHLCHGHLLPPALRLPHVLAQLAYLAAANFAGCYLIHVTNDKGYYAVMKRAPSIGTLWIWCVLELGLLGAVGGVLGPAFFAWWYDYGLY